MIDTRSCDAAYYNKGHKHVILPWANVNITLHNIMNADFGQA